MFIVVLECMPLPGPPDDHDSVDPKIYFNIYNSAILGSLHFIPFNIKATFELSEFGILLYIDMP